ncbi:hypothetical protein FDUTEX481_06609 [Tolypothrix sp. PCC 7601]|nr:hypothetical protein FDUTEX481_06609 [Tolypothrix sp. PCC 7601]
MMSFLTKCNNLRGVPRGETSPFGKPAVPSAATVKRSFRHGLLLTHFRARQEGVGWPPVWGHSAYWAATANQTDVRISRWLAW